MKTESEKDVSKEIVHKLNEGQSKASDTIFQFLLSDERECILTGPPGVGKTFMMEHVMQRVMQDYEDMCMIMDVEPDLHEIHLAATTNKAAEALAEATGHPTSTIHSLMNLKVFDNYETGKSKCKPTPNWIVHRNKIIIIDESSMIDADLYKYIREGTDKTCKVIYVGDQDQLAPVFEKISPVYAQKNVRKAALTEPVRNANFPALMALCEQYRESVKTGTFKPIQPVAGVIDYVDDEGMKTILNNDFKQQTRDARILCYTNKRCQDFNHYIRQLRQYPDTFVAGEILVNNSAVSIPAYGINLRVEQEIHVKEVLSDPKDVIIKDGDTMRAYDLKIGFNALSSNQNYIKVTVPEDYNHFRALLKYYAKQKDWHTFYKLKNHYPDFRQNDASTVYKAQGGTFDKVVIDLGDIGTCTDKDQAARMLYVAVSRAKSHISLYGQLPPRLTGG